MPKEIPFFKKTCNICTSLLPLIIKDKILKTFFFILFLFLFFNYYFFFYYLNINLYLLWNNNIYWLFFSLTLLLNRFKVKQNNKI